jgi:hypothetical protein
MAFSQRRVRGVLLANLGRLPQVTVEMAFGQLSDG